MQLTANDLGTLITLSAAAAGSIIVIIVNCIANSRCTDISLAWGCFHCIRTVPPAEEAEGGDVDEEVLVPPDAP